MRALIIIAAGALLAACGFQPMYGGGPETGNVLFRDMRINQTSQDSRTGYWLEDSLRRRLTAENGVDRAAEMTISSSEYNSSLGVLLSDRATRADLYLTVRYELRQTTPTGEALAPITGSFTSVATYNIPQSPYAEVTALADARKRAADDAAERIARDIALKTGAEKKR